MGNGARYLAAGVVALLASAGSGYWYAHHGVWATATFDPARWRAPMSYPGDPGCHRGRMVADLQRRVLRPQASLAAVEAALGPPDVIDASGGRSYHLGRCTGLRTRFDVLYLYFGTGERLNQATVLRY